MDSLYRVYILDVLMLHMECFAHFVETCGAVDLSLFVAAFTKHSQVLVTIGFSN